MTIPSTTTRKHVSSTSSYSISLMSSDGKLRRMQMRTGGNNQEYSDICCNGQCGPWAHPELFQMRG